MTGAEDVKTLKVIFSDWNCEVSMVVVVIVTETCWG
jgi:hypothetical protein